MRDYDIVCKACKVVMGIGPIVNPRPEDPIPEQWAFEGVFLEKDWRTHGRHGNDVDFLRVLQKFMILHRNHDIQIVPAGVSDFWESVHEDFMPVDPEEILAAPLNPPLDWVKERNDWHLRIVGKQFPNPFEAD